MTSEDRDSILTEIRLAVLEAGRDGTGLRTESVSKIVALAYPDSGWSTAEITQRLIRAAIFSGVARVPDQLSVYAGGLHTPACRRSR